MSLLHYNDISERITIDMRGIILSSHVILLGMVENWRGHFESMET